MNTWKPEGWHSITPRIVARDPAGLVKFLKDAFKATGDFHEGRPSVITIGDSMLMIGEVGPRELNSAFLYLYVQDVDATYHRALECGAISLEEPTDMPYGDRRGMIKDPSGNVWQIATHQRKTTDD